MQSPRFNAVREKAAVEADAKNLKATLVGKSHDEVTAILTKIVQEETARIMGMAQEELSLTQPLSDTVWFSDGSGTGLWRSRNVPVSV